MVEGSGFLALLYLIVAMSIGALFAAEPGAQGFTISIPLLLAAGLILLVVVKMTSPGRVRLIAVAMVVAAPVVALIQVVGRQLI